MLYITVTGKVSEVHPAQPEKGIQFATFVMQERRWRNKQADLVPWMVAVPSFLEKAFISLVHEGKPIGVAGKNLQVVTVPGPAGEPVTTFWMEAEELFIL